ncbi:hypothetical protein [Psychrobium sp. 1_MG-2023]|uniref:hypothetical protein n=1 Tax=Psychrobium sp. 1_MG-2023 TaxID=3062624 RepID=UPI000C33631E|nr:hypothetical protein [Psychrobium sp. 1_MG-2023]MDP2562166.1 hypothetical protein [Psychrobium sp. 1_MG-2023]PKF57163.1 hypothetical protein CW748_07160 [Alteromonadales bacterium alter-6D02]
MFYRSYKQLHLEEGMSNSEKKLVYKKLYGKTFKTGWPYMGFFCIFLLLMFAQYILKIDNPWLIAIFGGVGGLVFFQFQCIAVERLYWSEKGDESN